MSILTNTQCSKQRFILSLFSILLLLFSNFSSSQEVNQFKQAFAKKSDDLFIAHKNFVGKVQIDSIEKDVATFQVIIIERARIMRQYGIPVGFVMSAGRVDINTGKLISTKLNAGSLGTGCFEHLPVKSSIIDLTESDRWQMMEAGNECRAYRLHDDDCSRASCGRYSTDGKHLDYYFILGKSAAIALYNRL